MHRTQRCGFSADPGSTLEIEGPLLTSLHEIHHLPLKQERLGDAECENTALALAIDCSFRVKATARMLTLGPGSPILGMWAKVGLISGEPIFVVLFPLALCTHRPQTAGSGPPRLNLGLTRLLDKQLGAETRESGEPKRLLLQSVGLLLAVLLFLGLTGGWEGRQTMGSLREHLQKSEASFRLRLKKGIHFLVSPSCRRLSKQSRRRDLFTRLLAAVPVLCVTLPHSLQPPSDSWTQAGVEALGFMPPPLPHSTQRRVADADSPERQTHLSRSRPDVSTNVPGNSASSTRSLPSPATGGKPALPRRC